MLRFSMPVLSYFRRIISYSDSIRYRVKPYPYIRLYRTLYPNTYPYQSQINKMGECCTITGTYQHQVRLYPLYLPRVPPLQGTRYDGYVRTSK